MRKTMFFLMAIILCLGMLCGCEKETSGQEAQVKEVPFRVECVKEDGFGAYMQDFGHVYVKYPNANGELKEYDTVYITYSEDDLKRSSGTYLAFSYEETTYTHVLENVKSLRFPNSDEPTYG